MKKFVSVSLITLFVAAILVLSSCDRPTEPPNDNNPPNTTLANIPRENDTLFALVTLHWDGEDNDGFVSKYEYKYTTHRMFIGDSIEQPWRETDQTSLTIPFLSDDELNKQIFYIRAVDNNGDSDPDPAQKVFYTIQTSEPQSEIVIPESNTELYVNDAVNDWWLGIEFVFTGRDADGEIMEYAWAVDAGSYQEDSAAYTWTKDTSLFITPDKFKAPLTGQHVIKLISRDDTYLIDSKGDSVVINLVKPTFTKDILLIDETDEENFSFGITGRGDDAYVDSFYAKVFPTADTWDYKASGMPSREELGQYKLVIWHGDDRPTNQPHKIVDNVDQLKDYLNMGGKMIMGGWRILKSFAWEVEFPVGFEKGSFVHDYLHIVAADETVINGDCTGAYGDEGFSDVSVDSLKLAQAFPYFGKLSEVNIISNENQGGFSKFIYVYQNSDWSTYFEYRGRFVGVQYFGTVYDAIVLGFPMYFIEEEDAIRMGNEMLTSLGF